MKKITDAPLVMHCFDQENMVSGLLKGHNLAKAIVSARMYCKKLAAVTTTQQMGSLPDIKFELPTSPFTHASVDFLGHWSVDDSLKRRVKKKV